MKKTTMGLACFLAASTAATASSATLYPLPNVDDASAMVDTTGMEDRAISPRLPPGVALREISRLYNGKKERHATLHYFPQNWYDIGWRHQGSLGFISSTPFDGSRPLYACQLNGVEFAYFTSGHVGCEGHFLTVFGLIGYISATPRPDTTPLYRCHYLFKGRLTHFDTFLANCGNVPNSSNDGVLGYVFL